MGHLLVEDLAARGLGARWVGVGRPVRRLVGRPAGRGASHLGLREPPRGVPGLGPGGRARPAQRRRRLRLEHRQGLSSRPGRRPGCPSCPPCWRGRPTEAGRGRRRLRQGGLQADGGGERTRASSSWTARATRRGRTVAGAAGGRVGAHRGRGLGVRAGRPGRGPGAQGRPAATTCACTRGTAAARRPYRWTRSTPTWRARTVAGGRGAARRRLPYARVDLMRLADGTLAVGELEVTEPGFYLDLVPEVATAFARGGRGAAGAAGLTREAGERLRVLRPKPRRTHEVRSG